MIGSSENRISYNGNGIATEFAYNFIILEKSDIKVLHVAADGTEQLLTKDYYVDMEKSVVLYPGYAPGAEIPEQNRPPILPVGERLVLYREVPITQESALDKHWPFNVIANGLDKLTIICQQIWDRLQRSFYVSESTSTNFDPKVPIEAGKTFRVKDDGTGFEVTEDPGKVINGATALLEQTTEQANIAVESSTSAQNAATSVQKYKALWFDSVASMKAEPSLTAGAYVCTAGYYTPNDGGGASYLIRAKVDTDIADDGSLHELSNGLVAELIIENGTVCPEQFGAKGDGVTDDTVAIQKAIDSRIDVVLLHKKYKITNTVTINNPCNFICVNTIYAHTESVPAFLVSSNEAIVEIKYLLRDKAYLRYDYEQDSYSVGIKLCASRCKIRIFEMRRFTVGVELYSDVTSACSKNIVSIHYNLGYIGIAFTCKGQYINNNLIEYAYLDGLDAGEGHICYLIDNKNATTYLNNANTIKNVSLECAIDGQRCKALRLNNARGWNIEFKRIELADTSGTPYTKLESAFYLDEGSIINKITVNFHWGNLLIADNGADNKFYVSTNAALFDIDYYCPKEIPTLYSNNVQYNISENKFRIGNVLRFNTATNEVRPEGQSWTTAVNGSTYAYCLPFVVTDSENAVLYIKQATQQKWRGRFFDKDGSELTFAFNGKFSAETQDVYMYEGNGIREGQRLNAREGYLIKLPTEVKRFELYIDTVVEELFVSNNIVIDIENVRWYNPQLSYSENVIKAQ